MANGFPCIDDSIRKDYICGFGTLEQLVFGVVGLKFASKLKVQPFCKKQTAPHNCYNGCIFGGKVHLRGQKLSASYEPTLNPVQKYRNWIL